MISKTLHCIAALLLCILAGCSGGSSGTNAPEGDQQGSMPNNDGTQTEVDTNDPADGNSDQTAETDESSDNTGTENEVLNPEPQGSTRVTVNVTVPVYVSDALQVRLSWAGNEVPAVWVTDESWTVSADIPWNAENLLTVTFYDANGDITIGNVETAFITGSNPTEVLEITADQFETDRWDSDGDGVSNLDELMAGTNPLVHVPLDAVQVNVEPMADKIFRISWQSSSGVDFYRVLENPDGVSGFTQISDDLDASVQTFDHRVALFRRMNASYIVQSCNLSGCVDSDQQMVSGTLESAIGYFKASNPNEFDNFGGSEYRTTVSLSANGTTLAVSATGEDSVATGINGNQTADTAFGSGAVYVFQQQNGRWHQQAYLKSSNSERSDNFGQSLSLSADGNTLAIGATGEDSTATGINGNQNNNAASGSGAVYLFVRTGENWQQQAYLKASNTDAGDQFGTAVSLSSDGNSLAVGARGEDSAAKGVNVSQFENTGTGSGAAYVFTQINGNWQQQAYLKSSNSGIEDNFGAAVKLSGDGNTLVVGALHEDSVLPGINGDGFDDSAGSSGAVYVFTYSNGNWQQQAYVKASNPTTGDRFGTSVSLSEDGNTLAVGAHEEDSAATGINGDQSDNSAYGSGAAYLFKRVNGNWQNEAYVKAGNTDENDRFGFAVSLSADGTTLAVGAGYENSASTGVNGNQYDNSASGSGAAYVFVRDSGTWQEQAYLKAGNMEENDNFGLVLSLSADGNSIAVAAYREDSSSTGINGDQNDNSTSNSGAVYLY